MPVRRWSVACLALVALVAAVVAITPAPAQPARVVEVAPVPRAVGASPATGHAEAALLGKEAYLTPPKEIMEAVLAARGENVSLTNLSPDGRKFLVAKRDGLPSLARLGSPCVHLAEMAFNPVACRARDLWVQSAEGYELVFPGENRTVAVKAPAGARLASPAWSPDGSKLAFLSLSPDATHLRVADTETGESRQITNTPVLATLVTELQWSKDGKRIQTVLLPDGGKRPVPKLDVATEPKVRLTRDGTSPSRTYRYLLDSPFEMRLLEHLLTGQLALVTIADGQVTNVGAPAMFRSVSAAPGEGAFRVSTVKKPFSYFSPFQRFGSTESLWDPSGKSLSTLSDRTLREGEQQPPTPDPKTPTGPKRNVTKGKGGKGPDPDPDPMDPTDPDPVDPPTPGRRETAEPDAKRSMEWRPDGKGLSFLQPEPVNTKEEPAKKDEEPTKKDDAKAVVRKDRVMQWLPPFGEGDAKVVFESADRIQSVQYSEDGRWVFVTQTVSGRRQVTGIDTADPKSPAYVISRSGSASDPKKKDETKKDDTDSDDSADDEQRGGFRPGGFSGSGLMTKPVGDTTAVRVSSTGAVYVTGSDRGRGTSASSFAKPFIDAIDIKTGKKMRVFEGKGETLETVDAVDGDDIERVFTTRQNTKVVPDSFVTDLATGKATKLTKNVDRTPWYHDLKVERFKVTRADGFKFWVKVTTSPKATGKQPALFWIYPREYADQAAYDQAAVRGRTGGGTGRFTTPSPRSVSILTLAGYAVVEPDVPIVGPTGRMNDNYIPDLRNGLWAAIDECDKRGLIDRDRLACGGHSYGAFSTANAMAHTPFFKAGIAGDGCFNRTLTSMSFQSERRQLWDAREQYLEMSPLLWANRVNGALLMYHGMEDANVGTNPINSEAMFAALDGLGKEAALYMYPYEGHGPIARETNLDLWARWLEWLDKHVKSPKK